MSDGFIMVATCKYAFYRAACNAAETLRDHYEDANITLFTHPEWVDDMSDVFDHVVTDGVPYSPRAKLWALSRSPYDRTMYIDADSEVQSDDIQTAHDQLAPSDDMVMALIRPYAAAVTQFPGGELTLHCGMFTYRRSPTLYEMFDRWFVMWETQQKYWDLDENLYPRDPLCQFDIFTFWRLLNLEGYKDRINIGIWEEDARWNFHGFREEELNGKDPIVYHHTITEIWEDERNTTRGYYGT